MSSGGASSCSGSDAEDSEVEAETKEDNAAETIKTSEPIPHTEPENPVPMETSDKDQQAEDAEMMEVSSPAPTEPAASAEAAVEAHTEARDSAGDSQDKTELEVSDSTEVEAVAAAAAEGTDDPAGGSAAESEPERGEYGHETTLVCVG